jgi:phage gp16-like protein
MTAAATKGGIWRKQHLAMVHVAKKQLALTDEAYRDILERMFQVRSAGDLKLDQLGQLLDHLKTLGFRYRPKHMRVSREKEPNLGNGPVVAKLRALWLALFYLGLVHDRKDAALLVFVKRQTKTVSADGRGTQALSWLKPDDAHRVIEALKTWAARDGGVIWGEFEGNPRACVISAQARKLETLRVYRQAADVEGLAQALFGSRRWWELGDENADRLIRALGDMIRRARK